jgi:hypothetical protein
VVIAPSFSDVRDLSPLNAKLYISSSERKADMTGDAALHGKRGELKGQLEAGEYKTLVDVMLDETGRLIQKLTQSREPVPFWVSGVVVALVTLSIGLLLSLVFGEFVPARREAIVIGPGLVVFALVAMLLTRIAQGILWTTLCDHLLDTIGLEADLADLQRWLAASYRMRKQLLFCIAWAAALTSYVVAVGFAMEGGFMGVGMTFLSASTAFQYGTLLYSFILIVSFCTRLSRYQIKLYATDPGSSGIIGHLSAMIENEAFIGAVLSALYTLFYASIGQLTLAAAIGLVVGGWALPIAVFVTGQRALTKIITRGKQKTLDGIQAKIDELTAQGNIADRETTDAVNRLMDLHERIKGARSSALDLGAGLKFLNSLLLPLIAFLLSNLDRVLELFR